MGGELDHSFWNLLDEGGIAQNQMIHIEFVNVREDGAFANKLTWLVNLMNVEGNCRCFVFWNVGTSFLLSGGLVTDLFNINKHVRSGVENVGVQIRSRTVDMRHKFVLVPLVYNKFTCDRDFKDQDMARDRGFNPVLGQSFSKFMAYNKLVMEDAKSAYSNSFKELGDPNKILTVKTQTSTCTVYDKDHITVKHSLKEGNNPKDSRQMNDRERQSYFVLLVKWVKKNYEEETLADIMAKGDPPKRTLSCRVPPYI